MTEQDPDARIAEQSADYVFSHYESVRPRDMFELALLHAALDAVTGVRAAIKARVRAEVAGQINLVADMLDGLALREQGGLERYDPAAEAFRRSAGIVRTLAAGSSPDTTPEPAREDYPGQLSTPDACPVCGGKVEVDRLDVTSVFTPMAERPKTIPGRWWCPKGCDPRTTSEDS